MKVTKVTMKNIFASAKFGDKFRTRDGRMAILLQTHNCAVLAINFDSYAVTHDYKMDGTSVFNCHDLDIVSKWQEPINEKKLDRLADSETYEKSKEFDNCLNDILSLLSAEKQLKLIFKKCLMWAFKVGYRKAMKVK